MWLVGGTLFTLYRSLSPADAVQHTVLTPARPLWDIALTQELVQKENHFRALIQSSSDVIMVAAPNGVLHTSAPLPAGSTAVKPRSSWGRN